MSVEMVDETPRHCVYAFGPPGGIVGRARVEKTTGDVELLDLTETDQGPSEQFYLAHLVPRLQEYHARDTYPDRETWEA